MTYEVRVRPEAENDIENAALWYESQLNGLGIDFLDVVSDSFDKMKRQPFAYPVVHRNTHRLLINRFPFAIFFRVEESVIVVIAVMHGSRDPSRWKERL